VVGGLGFCGIDRKRAALTGAEQRPCWTGTADSVADGVFATLGDHDAHAEAGRERRPLRVIG
jgi:hypothetical protein